MHGYKEATAVTSRNHGILTNIVNILRVEFGRYRLIKICCIIIFINFFDYFICNCYSNLVVILTITQNIQLQRTQN